MLPRHNRIGLNRNYFALPHPVNIIILLCILPFILVAAIDPDLIPVQLGPVREAANFLASSYPTALFYTVVVTGIAHVFETLYAWKLCYDAEMNPSATVKWMLSTSVFGFTSVLLRLRPYLQRAKRAQF